MFVSNTTFFCRRVTIIFHVRTLMATRRVSAWDGQRRRERQNQLSVRQPPLARQVEIFKRQGRIKMQGGSMAY